MVEKRSPGKDVGEADVESGGRQIKHQMIARINKDFVPACRYGLRGLHDGQHVQLPSCTNSGLALPRGAKVQTACIAYRKLVAINYPI